MKTVATITLLLSALIVSTGCGGARHAVVLITIGGLRSDAVEQGKTPRLATLLTGEHALRYHASSPETIPSLAALMTGESPDRMDLRYGDLSRIPPGTTTLAERLRERGYRTAAFVSDGSISERTGLGRGFDLFATPTETGDQAVTASEVRRVRPMSRAYLPSETITDLVGQHLRRIQLVRKAFVWIHLSDAELVLGEASPRTAYGERIGAVEGAVAYVEDALRTFDMDERTHLIVVSAHGMALGERGEQGHGLTLAPGVIDVAAGVSGPSAWDRDRAAGPLDSAGVGRQIARLAGVGSEPDSAESLAASFAFVAQREYGVAPRAAAGDARGWLVLDPVAEWRPAAPATGPVESWPEAHADRLREGGVPPEKAPKAEAVPSLKERLGAIQEIRASVTPGAEAGSSREALAALIERAPDALVPRLALLRMLSPPPGKPLGEAASEIALDALRQIAAASIPRNIDLGRALLDTGRAAEARRVVEQLDAETMTAGERLAAARILEGAGDGESALGLVTSVLEGEREAPELHEWSGDLALREGNGFRARVAYEAAIESPRRETANVLAKLGDAFRLLGDDDAALQRYAAALELDPSYLYPHARASEVYLARDELGAAAHAIVQSIPNTQDGVADALARAERLQAAGLVEAARAELQGALEARPGSRTVRLRLARLHARQGDRETASKLVEEILADAPDNPPALYERARFAALAGREDVALEALTRLAGLAGSSLAERVRADAVFRDAGPDSVLARAAAAVPGVEREKEAGAPGGGGSTGAP